MGAKIRNAVTVTCSADLQRINNGHFDSWPNMQGLHWCSCTFTTAHIYKLFFFFFKLSLCGKYIIKPKGAWNIALDKPEDIYCSSDRCHLGVSVQKHFVFLEVLVLSLQAEHTCCAVGRAMPVLLLVASCLGHILARSCAVACH